MTIMTVVYTERLQLIACPAHIAAMAVSTRRQAETLLGWHMADGWPGDDIRGYLPLYAHQLQGDPTLLGWGLWLVIHPADGLVIGDVGYKGKPDTSGTVDIGYGIVPAYRRQGYAFEAARGLADWALAHHEVRRITGDCLPENVASARILAKLGMKRIGISSDGLLLWELRK
jgi:ribosomal-protein-alanine N-acetyltransferase